MAVVVLAAATASAKAQDVAAGEQSFRKCLPCHSVGEDARNKIGPVLNGLDGRVSGTLDMPNNNEYDQFRAGSEMALAIEVVGLVVAKGAIVPPGTKL